MPREIIESEDDSKITCEIDKIENVFYNTYANGFNLADFQKMTKNWAAEVKRCEAKGEMSFTITDMTKVGLLPKQILDAARKEPNIQTVLSSKNQGGIIVASKSYFIRTMADIFIKIVPGLRGRIHMVDSMQAATDKLAEIKAKAGET